MSEKEAHESPFNEFTVNKYAFCEKYTQTVAKVIQTYAKHATNAI